MSVCIPVYSTMLLASAPNAPVAAKFLENKSMCIFHIELLTVRPAKHIKTLRHRGRPTHVCTIEFLKLATYARFFMIIQT